MGDMSDTIFRELAKAPYWHPTPPEVWPYLAEGWSDLATDPEVKVWLAVEGEKVLGTLGFWDLEETAEDMLTTPKMFTFSVAATRESDLKRLRSRNPQEQQAAVEQWLRDGVVLTLRELTRVCENNGLVEVAPSQGEGFDPERHQAMSAVETDQVPPGAVVQVFQKGYVLNEQLLRPALVAVAKHD